MPTAPTLSDFRTRFPEFASQSDARVELFIADAVNVVGVDWRDSDYQPAVLYLAAFYLQDSITAAAVSSTGAPGVVKSQSMDGMSQTYETNDGSVAGNRYMTNAYGRRFMQFARANVPMTFLV